MAEIRKARKITQVSLAIEMGYSDALIGNYENNRCPVSHDVLGKFKTAAKVQDIPLTDDELASAMKEMSAWNDLINFGDIAQVIEQHNKFERYVQWAFDQDLENLFDIFRIKYLCRIGKPEECDKLLESLKEREQSFTSTHLYWYYRYQGFLEHMAWRYKTAQIMYQKAEVIGDKLNLNDKALYYNIGNCMITMGYPYLAIDYLERVAVKQIDLSSIRYGFTTQKLLAICYGRLGLIDKAIGLLNNYLEYLMNEKKDDRLNIYGVYLNMGRVYQEAGDYNKALEHYDKAAHYCKENDEAFLEYICYKASFLREYNKADEVRECLNKGLPLTARGNLWYEWLQAIKHSLDLDNDGSINYIIYTAIPRLKEYGKYTIIISCYKWLSDYYKRKGKYKPALSYSEMASDIFTKLMKGDLGL